MSFSYGVSVKCDGDMCYEKVDPQEFFIKVQVRGEVHVFCSHQCYHRFFFFV